MKYRRTLNTKEAVDFAKANKLTLKKSAFYSSSSFNLIPRKKDDRSRS